MTLSQNEIPQTGACPPGLVLLGPTGAGKTPLGDTIERRGLWDRSWVHFDFGAHLRAIVQQNQPTAWLSTADLDFLRQVLQSGALLEEEQFRLAAGVLRGFLHQKLGREPAGVVLNGLPRHEGQARALEAIVDVRWVVTLTCAADTVLARIRHDTGGDRGQRTDDQREEVLRRLETYARRTVPLVEHYRRRGVCVLSIDVSATLGPDDMWRAVNALGTTAH